MERKRKAEQDRQEAMKKEMNEAELRVKIEEAEARRKTNLKSFKLEKSKFESGKSVLSAEAKEEIKELAQEIKKHEYKKITIEGHTDITGQSATNMRLSRERAGAVYREFEKNGIEAEKMEYVGFAASMPIENNNTSKGRAANRRTEIYVE